MSLNKPAVVLIGPLPPPEGGMTTSLRNLANSELKDKYSIIILDITGYRSRKKGRFLRGAWYQIKLIFRLVRILLVESPKIVHVQMKGDFYFYRRSIDIIISKLFGKKVIFHLRGARFVEFYEKSSFFTKLAVKFIFAISDKIVALSEGWRKYLSGISNAKKIIVIPNGVRISDFVLAKNKKSERGFQESHVFVIFMGPIGKRKGALDVLKAIPKVVERVKNVSFIFTGNEEFDGELRQFNDLVQEMRLEKYIIKTGEISGQEKLDYYLSSDIFILASYAENLPNAMLEAMAAGLPVVVSDVGAIPEVVDDGINGFIIKPGAVDRISDKIVVLAQDAGLRKEIGAKNLGLVKEKYDMSVIAGKIGKIYQELL